MARKYIKNKYRNRESINLRIHKISEKYQADDQVIFRNKVRGEGMKEVVYLIRDLPISREDAKKINHPLFFTKMECENGHLAPLYTSQNQCIVCSKIRSRRSDRKHKRVYNRIKFFSLEQKLIEVLKMARNRAHQYDKHMLDFNIDLDYIKKLWQAQDGKCFYLNMNLNWNDYSALKYNSDNNLYDSKKFKILDSEEIKFHDSLIVSFDKVEPKKGYTKDNVVLCSRVANYMKGENSIDNFENFSREIASKNLRISLNKILSKASKTRIDDELFYSTDLKQKKLLRAKEVLAKYMIKAINEIKKSSVFNNNIYGHREIATLIASYELSDNDLLYLEKLQAVYNKNISMEKKILSFYSSIYNYFKLSKKYKFNGYLFENILNKKRQKRMIKIIKIGSQTI